jgi:adenylosuccinate synthase
MSDERDISAHYAVDDPTNRPNAWQGRLRFGLLDPGSLAEDIAADLALASGHLDIEPSLAVTCLDQVAHRAAWLDNGQLKASEGAELVAALGSATGLPTIPFSAP